jgi:hypothetical protein
MRPIRIAAALAMLSGAGATVVACDALIGLDSLKDRLADGGDDGSTTGRDGTVPGDSEPPDGASADAPGGGDSGGSADSGGDTVAADTGDAPLDSKTEDQYAPTPDTGVDTGGVKDAGVDAYEACVPLNKPMACGTMQCGMASDGCQSMLSCGTCALPLLCGGGGVANVCGDPDAGCTPASRFTVIDLGNGGNGSGTGRVYDSMTGLTWMRFNYVDTGAMGEGAFNADCLSRTMRLPTESEAKAVANAYDSCAWPAGWDTWTSTMTSTFPPAWAEVSSNGSVGQAYISNYQNVLCVTP